MLDRGISFVLLIFFFIFFDVHLSPITYHLSPSFAFADVPRTLHYQGRLTDANGTPLVGDHTITLRLYDAATGGSTLWEEDQDVTLARSDGGIFSVLLGSRTPFPAALTFNEPLWLAVAIDGGAEFSPRQSLSAVSYAVNADLLDGLDASRFLQLGAAGELPTIDGVNLTSLNADNLTSGTVPDGRLSTAVSLLGSAIESAEVTDGTLISADTTDTFLVAGNGVTVNKDANAWNITAVGSGGTITGVAAGAGLSGGGASGTVTLALSRPVALADGGTGASNAAAARANLGAAARGANSDIMSMSGLTTPLSIAQGGTGASTAGGARANLLNCLPVGGVDSSNRSQTFQVAAFGEGGTNNRQDRLWPVPVAATVTTLRAFVNQAPGTGSSWTVTLRKNAANTSLACTISGTSQSCGATGTVSASAGDRLGIEFIEAGTASGTQGAGWSACVVPN